MSVPVAAVVVVVAVVACMKIRCCRITVAIHRICMMNMIAVIGVIVITGQGWQGHICIEQISTAIDIQYKVG